MNNQQIAEAFARGATTGKGSNLFIDGKTIYSYGRHFPVATRTARGMLFTSRGYSRTTAKHKGMVWRAILNAGGVIQLASLEGPETVLRAPTAAERAERKRAAAHEVELAKTREARRAKREAMKAARAEEAARNAPPAWTAEPVVADAQEAADAQDPAEQEVA